MINTSFNNKNESKFNFYKGVGIEKKRRNSSNSSSSSLHNNLNDIKNCYGNNKINLNSINNYKPFQNNQNYKTNSPHNLFSNSSFGNIFEPNNNLSSNNFKNNSNNNFIQNNELNEDKKINNLFITNNNGNINSYFTRKENTNENNNNDFLNNDALSISLNQSLSNSSKGFNGPSLKELEIKNDNIVKSIVYQEALCKENQQIHINALCELLKTEMSIFQQYQKKELQMNTYIESTKNLLKNQICQITNFNNHLEKLKSMVNQQVQIANLIDKIKSGQNNIVNNLFDNQMNNLKY